MVIKRKINIFIVFHQSFAEIFDDEVRLMFDLVDFGDSVSVKFDKFSEYI